MQLFAAIEKMVQRLINPARLKPAVPSAFKFIGLRIVAAAVAVLLITQTQSAAKAFDEYQLKAVFIYRLSLFITWPETVFTTPDQAFVIGIVGEDPFGVHLDQVVKDEKVGTRPIRIERYTSMADVLNMPCQMLFISPSIGESWLALKHQLQGHSILTISDMPRFAQTGGMINIQTEDNRVKIRINPAETRRARLAVSSKLLKVARQVNADQQEGR